MTRFGRSPTTEASSSQRLERKRLRGFRVKGLEFRVWA